MLAASAPELSACARSVWAKSRPDPTQSFTVQAWLPLHQHLADTAAIAGRLWDGWAPPSIKRLLASAIGSEAVARETLVWLAGIHDVGKASPAFAVQVPLLADDMREFGLAYDPRIADGDERRKARHELVGFLALRERLELVHGFDRSQAIAVASVVAAHHGRPATSAEARTAEALPHLLGTGAWADVRTEFLLDAESRHLSEATLDLLRTASLTQPALVVLSGLVIVADWIASSDAFELAPIGSRPTSPTAERARRAWEQLAFPKPWAPDPDRPPLAELFRRRFDLPPGSTPHPTQQALVDLASTIEQPELLILEAEMGSGKTEAALLAAEVLASRFGLSGIFVGLPTQATADGMFGRVLSWARRLGLDVPSSVFLAHGMSELNPDYAGLTKEAYFASVDPDHVRRVDVSQTPVVAHRWFSQPRRGPLSNFVVGTVDQALFAGLRSRYVMLRHLAFASKVVVIDEVHAYDEYMSAFLLRVLEWLGAYGVPVILLSATLPSGRRRDFIAAYDRGREALEPRDAPQRGSRAERRAARAVQSEDEPADRYASLLGFVGYPVVSASRRGVPPVVHTPPQAAASRVIRLERIDDDGDALVALLRQALREGGSVAVIRNTVARAQETAALLRREFGDRVVLAHARFLGLDRARKDRDLLSTFGRDGSRPDWRIVVATQVIEQSLDIDFDLMVTDAAPIDLLLQRSGRLHRHARPDRPAPLREPRLVITGVDRSAVPPTPDGGTTRIYSDAVVLRSLAALEGRRSITVPDDIAPLVEQVYGPDSAFVPDGWREKVDAAAATHRHDSLLRRHTAEAFTLGEVRPGTADLLGWISDINVDPELTPPGRATVRDSDETLEVIVLQRDVDGIVRTPGWLAEGAGIQIPSNEPPSWALTRIILGCRLRLPLGMCRGDAIDRHITTLERLFEFPTWHASHSLKGELVLVLDEAGRGRLNEFDVSYTADDGFAFSRRSATPLV